MPRTRRQSRQQSEYGDAVEEEREEPSAVSFSVESMAAMMESLQRSQAENFERLLDRVLDRQHLASSSTRISTAAPAPPAAGNFAGCTARFSGAPDETLDNFIDAVEAYKDCTDISEINALRGMSMLLTGDAATWWQGIKTTIDTWRSAIACLRSAFGECRPPYRLYRLLFSKEQEKDEKTELFVAKARAILAQIPAGDISEKVQLDMVYGLLHRRICKRIRREEITTFDSLLRKARDLDDVTEVDALDTTISVSQVNRSARIPKVAAAASPIPPAGEMITQIIETRSYY